MKKSIVFFVALLCASSSLFAQFKFGIQLGYNQTSPKIEKSDWDANNLSTTLDELVPQKGYGFSLGILARYLMTDRINITAQPAISFTASGLDYQFTNSEIEELKNESVIVRLPVQVEVHLLSGKVSPYLIGGAQWGYDLAEDTESRLVDLKTQFWLVHGGVGVDIPFKWFMFHPELIVATNVNNLLAENSDTVYNNALDNLGMNMLSIKFNFSGI